MSKTWISLTPEKPAINRAEVILRDLKDDPIARIQNHLGVPFIDNVFATSVQRLTLGDKQLAGWIISMASGI